MTKLSTVLALLLATGPTSIAADTVLSDLNAVRKEIYEKTSRQTAFDFTATITFVQCTDDPAINPMIAASDGTNSVAMFSFNDRMAASKLNPGDIVRFQGTVSSLPPPQRIARLGTFEILGSSVPPLPRKLHVADLLRGEHDFTLATVEGCVRDARRSETNPSWGLMVINDGSGSIYISLPLTTSELPGFLELVGSTVELSGIAMPSTTSVRYRIGRTFRVAKAGAIKTINRPPETELPLVDSITTLGPSEIATLGRHRANGKVIATWQGNHALLKTASGDVIGLELVECPTPQYGKHVEAIGFPESDLFHVNLTRATWKDIPQSPIDDGHVLQICGNDLVIEEDKVRKVTGNLHGKPIQLSGLVLSVASDTSGCPSVLYVNVDGLTLPVDLSRSIANNSVPAVGSKVEITGICIMETETWKPNSTFPQIRGFRLVPRTEDDIRVIASPPWWTPARLLIVIGLLLAATMGAVAWNVSLRRVAERRSRELLKAQLARIESDLKVGERTRLSVELHDTLSQNLLGASMEINTAEQLVSEANALKHLGIASKTLRASRDELRNCLWDLRSQSLEEPDMNAAIRKTLEPYVSDVDLQVRFNVPRTLFTDNTAHTLMRIIRELVLNAIRHGHAKSVKIAGSREKGQLLFSVRDDGCGFDPSAAPGISQGHFGLQGVRERLRLFKGSVRIDSSPGTGTYVSARFQLPTNETEKI